MDFKMSTSSILRNLFEGKASKIGKTMDDDLIDIGHMKSFISRHSRNPPIEPVGSSWQTFFIEDYTCIAKNYSIFGHENLVYFITEILDMAKRKNHHPILKINHTDVEIRLYTNDVKDVTHLDLDMANRIDEIYDDTKFIDELK